MTPSLTARIAAVEALTARFSAITGRVPTLAEALPLGYAATRLAEGRCVGLRVVGGLLLVEVSRPRMPQSTEVLPS